jgi:hypothetical protein
MKCEWHTVRWWLLRSFYPGEGCTAGWGIKGYVWCVDHQPPRFRMIAPFGSYGRCGDRIVGSFVHGADGGAPLG